jgi:hypothetical protein
MRALKLILALLSLAVGAGLVAVGIAGIQTFGSEGRLNLESPVLESGPESYALVIDVADVETGLAWSEKLGETTIGARSTDQVSLFVGLAATPDLDDYLNGVSYDVVRNEGVGWELSTVPGTKKPDSPRAEQFWTRRGTGESPTIPFKQASGGKTTFVTMNSDGGPTVAAIMTVGYRSSVIYPLSVGVVALGTVLILLAVFLVFRSWKKRTPAIRDQETPASPTESTPDQSAASSPSSTEDGADDTSAAESDSTEKVNDTPDVSETAKVDSESTKASDDGAWFRDGKTK